MPDSSGSRAALTPRKDGVSVASTVPCVGVSNPAMTRSRVLLPEPLCPTTPTDSPERATNDTSSTARTVTLRDQPRRSSRRAFLLPGFRSVLGTR